MAQPPFARRINNFSPDALERSAATTRPSKNVSSREAAEAKWGQAASERTVHMARETEHGTRNVFARMDAADAMRLMATIMLVAKHLRRDPGSVARPRPGSARRPAGGARPPRRSGPARWQGDRLRAHPRAARHRHRGRPGRGRRPFTRRMLQQLLKGSQITLKPVIDLSDGPAADSYEIPGHIAERVHLTQPADVFPFAEGLSRNLDLDHTRAYDDTGPPGQTRPGNLGKLNRRHHRIKTHAPGWTLTRLSRNRYWWTTPAGRPAWSTASAHILCHGWTSPSRPSWDQSGGLPVPVMLSRP